MEKEELLLSDKELAYIVERIINTRVTVEHSPKSEKEIASFLEKMHEPEYCSQEVFFALGFHPDAFKWLPHDIEFVLLNKGLIDNSDKDVVEFQKWLASDIEGSGFNQIHYLKSHYIAIAKSAEWCNFPFMRKAILCRLFKRSFSLLIPNVTANGVGKLEYPNWLPGKWLRKAIPSKVTSFK